MDLKTSNVWKNCFQGLENVETEVPSAVAKAMAGQDVWKELDDEL